MSSILSSLYTLALDMLLDIPYVVLIQWSSSPPRLSFSSQYQDRKRSAIQFDCWNNHIEVRNIWLMYNIHPLNAAIAVSLPCKVSPHRKMPPTWWYQNSIHHFYWRTCGSSGIRERTISVAIYPQCEPVHNKVTAHSRWPVRRAKWIIKVGCSMTLS